MSVKWLTAFFLAILLAIGVTAMSGCSSSNNNKQNPIVTIEMEGGGIIKVELYPDMAPNTVKNFISLISSGFYDGLGFHRILQGFMIQGGCPDGTGMGGPGYAIKGEFSSNGFRQNTLKHERGVISMARSQMKDSAGSQFFIMHQLSPHLDGDYAGFGKVLEGMEVVDDIVSGPTIGSNGQAVEPRIMKTVTVESFGESWDEPDKLPDPRG